MQKWMLAGFALYVLCLGDVASPAAPHFKLVNTRILPYAFHQRIQQFPYHGDVFSYWVDTACKSIIVARGSSYGVSRSLKLDEKLGQYPRLAVFGRNGERYLLAWDPHEESPLFGANPFSITPTTLDEIAPAGFERRAVKQIEIKGSTYAVFMGRPEQGYVPFYRINLVSKQIDSFNIPGETSSDDFDVFKIAGRAYGVISGIDGSVVFDVMHGHNGDIPVKFPDLFQSGIITAKVIQNEEHIRIPQINRKYWVDNKTISVQFCEPFAGGGPAIGDGMSPPVSFDANRLESRPGAMVQQIQLSNRASSFFIEDESLYGVFPITWIEGEQLMKRVFIYKQQWQELRQIALPPSASRPGGVLSSSRLDELTPEVTLLEGPDKKHYGLYVDSEGEAFLIAMATGQVLDKLKLSRSPLREHFAYSPNVIRSQRGRKTEYYFVTASTTATSGRQFTVQIEF